MVLVLRRQKLDCFKSAANIWLSCWYDPVSLTLTFVCKALNLHHVYGYRLGFARLLRNHGTTFWLDIWVDIFKLYTLNFLLENYVIWRADTCFSTSSAHCRNISLWENSFSGNLFSCLHIPKKFIFNDESYTTWRFSLDAQELQRCR